MKVKFIQRLINKIKEKRKAKVINKTIKRYRFIHIMFNDKFNKPFVDFLNRNFDTKEHLILCKRWFDEFPFPQGENVIEIQTLKKLNFANAEKIFCHSLFDNELVEYLYNHQDILKEKAYWQIWGGDLYDAPRDEENDFVRKKFRGYLTSAAIGDTDIAEQKYDFKIKEKYHSPLYPIITLEMIDEAKNSLKKRNATIIQINNSCDDSTIEMLDILSRFKDENIIIKTILSYGNLEFKEQIINKGNAIFGDKFEFIGTILSPQEYAKYTSQNDILILNQKRQQGAGNASLALAFGQKVYIRSEITTYNTLLSFGYKIFDTNAIGKINFKDFVFISDNTKQTNIEIYTKTSTEEYFKKAWKRVFSV